MLKLIVRIILKKKDNYNHIIKDRSYLLFGNTPLIFYRGMYRSELNNAAQIRAQFSLFKIFAV